MFLLTMFEEGARNIIHRPADMRHVKQTCFSLHVEVT